MKKFNIDLMDNFLYEKLYNQGIKETTIRTYYTLFTFMLSHSSPLKIDNLDTFTSINCKLFLGDLGFKRNWSNFTYNRNFKNLRVFTKHLFKQKLLNLDPFEDFKPKKEEKLLPKGFNGTQVLKIKTTVTKLFNTNHFLDLRNKTIFYLFLYSGLRLNELLTLKISDVDFLSRSVFVNKGKGSKDRFVPLSYEVIEILSNYLKTLLDLNFGQNLLFPSKNGVMLQHRDIYEVFDKISSLCDFKITPHMFRHTFATELVRKNINIYSISRILGHSNIRTTQIYLSCNVESIRDTIDLVNLYD